ncbi:hypothetical protein AURDEDRAFT_99338 [Auricularia subglabra TFB-10046 SS5]|nr:hypothetical protein AURDEDRAFT_99338 [Auricularia subglabra TFB-10046 SS5]
MLRALQDLENDPLPSLPRPPGLPIPVEQQGSHTPTYRDYYKRMTDPKANAAERDHLNHLLNHGHFSDLRALERKHGGKSYTAPSVLIREEFANYFPNVEGVAISDRESVSTGELCAGRVSLVAVLTTNLSEEHCRSFAQPALELHGSNPLFRFVQINLQESKMKYYVLSLFISNLRNTVPAHLQPSYMLSAQSFEYLRDPLLMENKYVGYVFLLDKRQRVRWAGCGFASPAERDALMRCAGVLLEREGAPVSDDRLSRLDRWDTTNGEKP